MGRAWVWLQLLVAWLPVAVLFGLLIVVAHPDAHPMGAVVVALRMAIAGAVLGVGVYRLTRRVAWPHGFSGTFLLVHLVAAAVFAVAFVLANSLLESLVRRHAVITIGGAGLGPFLILGVWLYVMIAGVAYANEATRRAARAEALAVSARLEALRSQLNPHFLFNALHTVVQLIPRDPRRASAAAEEVAGLLRATLEENRDLVTLDEELRFVRRYLAIEAIRFGDRLVIVEAIDPRALEIELPVFSLQTLVENAVRHGAAPRPEPTTIEVIARVAGDRLVLEVRDDGAGAPSSVVMNGKGTGMRRLHDRLAALYGVRARLTTVAPAGGGFNAIVELPAESEA